MTNPFFAPSALPFELPPFADIRDAHYLPAFERGFGEQLDEVEAIVKNPDAPTIENTLLPLERSGQTAAQRAIFGSARGQIVVWCPSSVVAPSSVVTSTPRSMSCRIR